MEYRKKRTPFLLYYIFLKESPHVQFLKPQKILRIQFGTFKICPKSKSASTFKNQNVSSFFLVPFFQLTKIEHEYKF